MHQNDFEPDDPILIRFREASVVEVPRAEEVPAKKEALPTGAVENTTSDRTDHGQDPDTEYLSREGSELGPADLGPTNTNSLQKEDRRKPVDIEIPGTVVDSDKSGEDYISQQEQTSTNKRSNWLRNFARRSLFGKKPTAPGSDEGSSAINDEQYVLKVLNLPLIEQTRITRISKRLETSRDKTEFWMPSFPWRALDYLNYYGTELEGLYRIPGNGSEIRKWQRKFDEELDVDLFKQDDLHDVNVIASMLKTWLRTLPEELFPKEAQERVARECADSERVPGLLVEELSGLPPFQYYLLFALTCHLSLLLAHSDKTKMDFRNLCICFLPCLKINTFCFKFLVCDWRDCWKGCKYEAAYIEQEYALFGS
ncbi:Rho GTPase activation protein [Thozetella sp. PMI_491]|nr:Rho GTPase activation protein [Thozetella sp. PMI_491]